MLLFYKNPTPTHLQHMYTFKTIISDFERPLNTSLEDSIHMPQNHNNRPRRKSRRYPEHKHANNAGLIQTADVVQVTNVVPLEQRHVAPTLMSSKEGNGSGSWSGCPEVLCSYDVQKGGFRSNRPTATLDARVRGDEEEGRTQCSGNQETRQPVVVAGGEQHAFSRTPQHSPTRVMFEKLLRRPEYKTRVSSPIFDEVMKLRGDVQEKILADTSEVTKEVKQDKVNAKEQNEPRAKSPAHAEKLETPEFIPDMEVSEDDWAEPLYELAAPERRREQGSRGVDLIAGLSDAINELRVFQGIGSSSRGDKVEIVTPPLEDVELKVESNVGTKADAVHAEAQVKNAEKSLPSMSSRESFKSVNSVSSDDFEKVELPARTESEENGGRRKWYKGFRR